MSFSCPVREPSWCHQASARPGSILSAEMSAQLDCLRKAFAQYQALKLPMALRHLPDLLVASQDVSEAFLVEVKFRRNFSETSARHLHDELRGQREHWPDSYAVLMIAKPFASGAHFHQDFIRLVPPDMTDHLVDERLNLESRWNTLKHIQHVFRKFRASARRSINAPTSSLSASCSTRC